MEKNKNREENSNKIIARLHYLSAICFYIVSIINFVNKNSMAVFYLCLGATFTCLGSVYLNKDKNKDKDNNKKE